MKNTTSVVLLALFLPVFATAQVEGDWGLQVPNEDGTTMTIKLSLKAGIYQVDMGNDGTVEVEGKYTIDGSTIKVQDVSGENACTGEGTEGEYTFTVNDKTFVMTRVKDACEGRGGPDGMQFTKL